MGVVCVMILYAWLFQWFVLCLVVKGMITSPRIFPKRITKGEADYINIFLFHYGSRTLVDIHNNNVVEDIHFSNTENVGFLCFLKQ